MLFKKLLIASIGATSIATTATALSTHDIPADLPIKQLLTNADTSLAQGISQDALVYLDVATTRDPNNYLAYFKRGAAYLSLGRASSALREMNQALTLKPDFKAALIQRAKIHTRFGDWGLARKDYQDISKGSGNTEDLNKLIEAEKAADESGKAEKKSDWDRCVEQSSVAIQLATSSLTLRQRRAHCRLEKKEIPEALADLAHTIQLAPHDKSPILSTSAMSFYSLAEFEQGVSTVSKCLQYDADDKACSQLRKSEKAIERSLKKIDKLFEKRQYATAVKLLVSQGEEEPGLLHEIEEDVKTYRELGYIHANAGDELYGQVLQRTCEAYVELKNPPKIQHYCDETLKHIPNSLPAALGQARREIDSDDFEAAVRTLKQAQEAHGNNHKIQSLLQEAQTLLKRSKQKDYYKVLGVTRDADEREIKRAFRKLTIQYHPDKAAKNGITQEEAQKKMSAINEAYEVLSDPELKQQFDNGHDPNDPTAGQQQPFQGSPFGGQPMFFQQGGQHFHFKAGGFGF